MLLETLEKQLSLHKSLLQLAHLKTDAIKQNNMDNLNKIVREEQKHVGAITILEKRRMGESDETVSDILPSLPPDEQKHVECIRDELIGVLLQLKEVNALNFELVEQSFQFVQLQLDLLAPPDAGTYAPDGDDVRPASGPLFDSKV
ncbi:hypothetical protein BTO30_01080 [Domibacillus antri]|uniref:Flagellar protein FlgN n=1 Tax=Domibacillus antri TaxID=1714264 RepID=A0A1Q8Q9S1_9BACI|nr:flagellar protein FlgN [Domibacillus antri]OLN24042.1 hypothetical protein BTO30_01080 [Domibacillus antri]